MQRILHSSLQNTYMYQFPVQLANKFKHGDLYLCLFLRQDAQNIHTQLRMGGEWDAGGKGVGERERTCLHFALLVFARACALLSRVGRRLGIVWEEELGEAILVP